MTFNKNSNFKSMPLIEDGAQEQFILLQKKFLEYVKNFDEITEYDRRLNSLTRKEYDKIKDDIHYKIRSMPEILSTINNTITILKNSDYKDLSLKAKVNEQIRITTEKMSQKKEDLPQLINRIVEKESRVAKKLSGVNPDDIAAAVGNSFDSTGRLDSEASYKDDKKIIRGSFQESKLMVKEIVDNNEYLKRRQEALEEIKKVSGQIKDMTVVMKVNVQEQGDKLNAIEDNIITVGVNTKKAELEISNAEKETRKSSRKLCCLAFIVLFVVISIVAVLLMIFLGKTN